MNAIWLTLFVSLVLAGLGVLLFFVTYRDKTRDHIDRLSLLPLENDNDTQEENSDERNSPTP